MMALPQLLGLVEAMRTLIAALLLSLPFASASADLFNEELSCYRLAGMSMEADKAKKRLVDKSESSSWIVIGMYYGYLKGHEEATTQALDVDAGPVDVIALGQELHKYLQLNHEIWEGRTAVECLSKFFIDAYLMSLE